MFLARAVLFDMDGVVIDTRQSVTDFWQAVAGEHHVTLTCERPGPPVRHASAFRPGAWSK